MNSVVVLGIIGFAIWWVHRLTERRRRPSRRPDDAFSHALLPSKDWR
ncbi:MAG: hypothetical protein JO322_08365 [Candidatus Eremiobacteraeota bacterium]|nr:hypothetical protein [Candidatus Eremiobacteraeota bacterium]